MFTVKTENELIDLLKVIAEEAVSFSKKSLAESDDPYVGYYQEKLKADQENLFEEEEPEDAPEEESAEEEPAQPASEEETTSAEPEAPSEEPAEAEQPEASFGSSLDTLMKSINSVRAGQSLKNSAISDQLEIYYDRLAEDERNVLSLFVRELAKILSGAIEGVDAADPSDPPPQGLNVNIVTKGEEAEPASGAAPAEEPSEPAEEEQEEEPVTDEPAEDTTPPIRVNERQDLSEVRKKVRSIFYNR